MKKKKRRDASSKSTSWCFMEKIMGGNFVVITPLAKPYSVIFRWKLKMVFYDGTNYSIIYNVYKTFLIMTLKQQNVNLFTIQKDKKAL